MALVSRAERSGRRADAMGRLASIVALCGTLSSTACADGLADGGGADAGVVERVRVVDRGPVDEALVPAGGLPAREGLDDGLALFDLGGLPTSPDGASPVIEVDVEEGTRSLAVLAFVGEHDIVIPVRVESPSGVVVLDDTPPPGLTSEELRVSRGFPGQLMSPVRALASSESMALVLPSASSVPLEPGTWRLALGAFVLDASTSEPAVTPTLAPMRVGVLLDDRVPTRSKGVLDVVVHIGVEGLAAEAALDDARVAAGVNALVAAFDVVDIDVRVVETRGVLDASLRTIALDDDTCTGGDLAALFREVGDAATTLHLFFVERFTCVVAGGIPVGQGIAGIAGGIPGVGPSSSSSRAGVAIAMDFFEDHETTFPTVVAHEVAHFLGLFHTRESTTTGVRAIADLVDDTPETFPEARANLMSPIAGTDRTLTVGQGAILRRHPLVRP